MAVEQYTTLGASTLSGSYTSGGSSLSVTSASSFPTGGNFRVRVDNEIFKVTAVSGGTFTVTGAQEGTSAANHSSGAAITEIVTALAWDAIRSDQSGIGVYSSVPSTTGQAAGNQYHATDKVDRAFVFDGSLWQPFGAFVPQSATGAPQSSTIPLSGWSIVNGAKINDFFTDRIQLHLIDAASLNWRFYSRSNASSGYTLIAAIRPMMATPAASSQTCGVYLSDGTKYTGMELLSQAGSPNQLRIERMNSTTSDNATPFGPTANLITGGMLAVKVVDDGVHRTWSYWTAGAWVQALQEATNVFLTETQAAIGGVSIVNNTSYCGQLELIYWSAA